MQPVAINADADLDEATVIVNDGPEGNSGLTFMNNHHPLDAAIGNVWGVTGDHYRVDFTLSNGNFTIAPVIVDGAVIELLAPAQASTVFHAKMFSPGNGFAFNTYSFIADQSISSSLPGVGFFTAAFVGIDGNDDGMVTENEQHPVIHGVVEFAGALPDIELRFQVTLASGEHVSGEYTGLFDFPVL